jgi:hypothetical protein
MNNEFFEAEENKPRDKEEHYNNKVDEENTKTDEQSQDLTKSRDEIPRDHKIEASIMSGHDATNSFMHDIKVSELSNEELSHEQKGKDRKISQDVDFNTIKDNVDSNRLKDDLSKNQNEGFHIAHLEKTSQISLQDPLIQQEEVVGIPTTDIHNAHHNEGSVITKEVDFNSHTLDLLSQGDNTNLDYNYNKIDISNHLHKELTKLEDNTILHNEENSIPHNEENSIPHNEENSIPHNEENDIPLEETHIPLEETHIPLEETHIPLEETHIPLEETHIFSQDMGLVMQENQVVTAYNPDKSQELDSIQNGPNKVSSVEEEDIFEYVEEQPRTYQPTSNLPLENRDNKGTDTTSNFPFLNLLKQDQDSDESEDEIKPHEDLQQSVTLHKDLQQSVTLDKDLQQSVPLNKDLQQSVNLDKEITHKEQKTTEEEDIFDFVDEEQTTVHLEQTKKEYDTEAPNHENEIPNNMEFTTSNGANYINSESEDEYPKKQQHEKRNDEATFIKQDENTNAPQQIDEDDIFEFVDEEPTTKLELVTEKSEPKQEDDLFEFVEEESEVILKDTPKIAVEAPIRDLINKDKINEFLQQYSTKYISKKLDIPVNHDKVTKLRVPNILSDFTIDTTKSKIKLKGIHEDLKVIPKTEGITLKSYTNEELIRLSKSKIKDLEYNVKYLPVLKEIPNTVIKRLYFKFIDIKNTFLSTNHSTDKKKNSMKNIPEYKDDKENVQDFKTSPRNSSNSFEEELEQKKPTQTIEINKDLLSIVMDTKPVETVIQEKKDEPVESVFDESKILEILKGIVKKDDTTSTTIKTQIEVNDELFEKMLDNIPNYQFMMSKYVEYPDSLFNL